IIAMPVAPESSFLWIHRTRRVQVRGEYPCSNHSVISPGRSCSWCLPPQVAQRYQKKLGWRTDGEIKISFCKKERPPSNKSLPNSGRPHRSLLCQLKLFSITYLK